MEKIPRNGKRFFQGFLNFGNFGFSLFPDQMILQKVFFHIGRQATFQREKGEGEMGMIPG